MFDLYDKRTGKLTKIYSVQEDNHGYPKFLIRDSNKWLWQSAKHYITEKERRKIAYDKQEQKILDKYGELDSYFLKINNCLL